MRCKRYKAAPVCWIAGPLPIGTVLLRRCGDERDGLLATRCVLADVPYVIWRPCPLAGDSLGLGLVFRELSKLLHQEDALGAPCLDTVILALHRRALAGRSTARPRHAGRRAGGMLRTGVIRHFEITLRLATPDNQAGKR